MTARVRLAQACLFLFAEECAFLLAATHPQHLTPAAVLPIIAFAAAAFGLSWFQRRPPRKCLLMGHRFTGRWPWLHTGLGALAVAWGWWYGVHHPAVLPVVTGTACEVEAHVTTVRNYGARIELVLAMDRLTAGYGWLQPLGTVRYSLRSAGGTGDVAYSPGMHVVLRGTLFPTPSTDNRLGTRLMDLANPSYTFVGHLVRLDPPTPVPSDEARAAVGAAIERQIPDPAAKLVLGVVFGDATPSASVKQTFLSAGLLHVLAASGANVWLLEGAAEVTLYRFFRRWSVGRSLWQLLVIGGVWAFAALCQDTPSITRAAWMSTYRRVGAVFNRRSSPALGLAYAAVAMCTRHPEAGWSASAWLSFTATVAVLRAVNGGRGRHPTASAHRTSDRRMTVLLKWGLQRAWHTVSTVVRLSLRVEWAMLPLEAGLFQQLTPYAVIANVLSEPILAALLPVSVVAVSTALMAQMMPMCQPLAHLTGSVAGALAASLVRLASCVAGWPGALQTVQLADVWWLSAVAAWWFGPLVMVWARRAVFRVHAARRTVPVRPGSGMGGADESGRDGAR